MQIPCKPVHVTIRRVFLKSKVFHNIVAKLKECVQRVDCNIKCNSVQIVLTNCESHASAAS